MLTNHLCARGVAVFSQRRKVTEWFDVQYEEVPHYCFSLVIASLGCKNLGERVAEAKLPYCADRLCAPDDKKKKTQGTRSAGDYIGWSGSFFRAIS
jgi:hypothetical protein